MIVVAGEITIFHFNCLLYDLSGDEQKTEVALCT